MTTEQEAGASGTASTKHLKILVAPCLSPELKPLKVLSWPDIPEDGSNSSLCFLEVSRRLKGTMERMQDRDGFNYNRKSDTSNTAEALKIFTEVWIWGMLLKRKVS